MHVREAERTLELLRKTDDQWDQLVASDPLAIQYLRLGAISPDFQHGSTELNFGHSKALSYHLLENAPADRPDLRLFALGHLIHLAGDATAEVFVSPWVWAAHPLGVYDLFVGGDNSRGESETIMEGFSEITLGSWDPVVDVLYDFYLEGEEARGRMDAILEWYCEQGKAQTGGDNDCQQVRLEIFEKLDTANELLGTLTRDEGKAFFHNLMNRPPDDLIWLFTGGLLQSLIGSSLDPSAHAPWEVRRFKDGIFGDEQWWEFYEESFADMAPAFTRDHLETQNTSWPEYNGGALAGGNHQSVMQFLPERYSYGEGLIVDQLLWLGSDGQPVDKVTVDGGTSRHSAQVRFFGTLPVAGTVRGVVRKDRPGFLATDDEVLGEATLEVDIRPNSYTTEGRSMLTIEFDAHPDEALGYYVELLLDDEPLPWFTSSWDALWSIEEAPLFWGLYRDNFGTYDRFPGSLRYAGTEVATGALFVTLRYDVADLAVPDAEVSVDGSEPVRVGGNGLVAFDRLDPGARNVTVTFPGLEPIHATAEVVAAAEVWLDLTLGALPQVSAPKWSSDGCVPLAWDPVVVGGPLATALFARLTGTEEWTELPVIDDPALCVEASDGDKFAVEVLIEFGDDHSPEIAKTEEVSFDSSAPELAVPTVSMDCNTVTVDFSPAEPHSGMAELRFRLGADEWTTLAAEATSLSFESLDTEERTLTISVINGAGLETLEEITIERAPACTDGETEGADPPPTAEDMMDGKTTTAGRATGCALTPPTWARVTALLPLRR
jgi:hypothetical protein